MAEEDVKLALDRGSVTLFRNGELGTEIGARHGASSGVPITQRSRGKVSVETVFVQTSVCWASLYRVVLVRLGPCSGIQHTLERVTASSSLRSGGGRQSNRSPLEVRFESHHVMKGQQQNERK